MMARAPPKKAVAKKAAPKKAAPKKAAPAPKPVKKVVKKSVKKTVSSGKSPVGKGGIFPWITNEPGSAQPRESNRGVRVRAVADASSPVWPLAPQPTRSR